MSSPLVVYVDVDDTLVRDAGRKRMPVAGVAAHVRQLFEEGAQLFCWSSGGAEYAKAVALELKIADCFSMFLPKPQVMLDDQAIGEWKQLLHVHPLQCVEETCGTYRNRIEGSRNR